MRPAGGQRRGSLAGATATFALAPGSRLQQAWNLDSDGDAGRIAVRFPGWARATAGVPHTAGGFCVAGDGAAGDVTVG